MRLIELQNYDDYSVIVRQDDKGNLLPCEPFVVAYKPNIKDGEVVDWSHGHYFEDLFDAVNYARTKLELYQPSYYRLCEIASKAIDGLIEDDTETAYEYFAREIEIDNHEADYFGLNKELLDSYK
jgi:hypothetical protein